MSGDFYHVKTRGDDLVVRGHKVYGEVLSNFCLDQKYLMCLYGKKYGNWMVSKFKVIGFFPRLFVLAFGKIKVVTLGDCEISLSLSRVDPANSPESLAVEKSKDCIKETGLTTRVFKLKGSERFWLLLLGAVWVGMEREGLKPVAVAVDGFDNEESEWNGP